MRLLVVCLMLSVVYANAFFTYGNFGDNRLQSENNVYKPGGIINYTLGVGVFDESQNIVDYKMSFGFTRAGYSYDDGDESVSFYMLDFNLVSWSVTYMKILFEAYAGFSYLLVGTNFSDFMEKKVGDEFIDHERIYPKYGYRLGYCVTDNLLVSLTANYNYVRWRGKSWLGNDHATLLIGGFGLSVQYNIF